jgi:Right handed beta helix region
MRRLRQGRRLKRRSLLIAVPCFNLLSISPPISAASASDTDYPTSFIPPTARTAPPPTGRSSRPTERCSLYVSPSGSDLNPGSVTQPFQHAERAKDAATAMIRRGMRCDITIRFRSGVYYLGSTLKMGPADSGQNGFRVVYESYPGEHATLSGGKPISGWSLYDEARNIYRAKVGTGWIFRQVYVNGRRTTRARGDLESTGLNKSQEGFDVTNTSIEAWKDLTDVEVVFLGKWMMNRCKIASVAGDLIKLVDPCWRNSLWSSKWDAGAKSPSWIENAYELLEIPGEWYLDRRSGYLYYMPRDGEDMRTAEVISPCVQDMIIGHSAHDILFKGITFAHSNWTDPDQGTDGYVGLQAGYHRVGETGTLIRMHAPLYFSRARNISFIGNLFTQLGSRALTFDNASQYIEIRSNRFIDTAGGAVQIGGIDDGRNTIPGTQNSNVIIAENDIERVSRDYPDDGAIVALYVTHLLIEHNEISEIPHIAISVGWGWGKEPSYARDNEISWNYIHNFSATFPDSAAIYTLGPMKDTSVHDNYIKDGGQGYGCLYPDQGSAYQTWTRNVCENVDQWLHVWTSSIHSNRITDNWSNTASVVNRGADNTITNNMTIVDGIWPVAAQQVIAKAGLQK